MNYCAILLLLLLLMPEANPGQVEMNNCYGAAFNTAYIRSYLAPVSAAIAAAAAAVAGGGSAPPFIFADPYFEPCRYIYIRIHAVDSFSKSLLLTFK